MSKRSVAVLVLLASLTALAAPASALEKGTGELGLFGRVTRFDTDQNLADWGGIGARLGYFLTDRWELEVDAASTKTDGIITDGLRQNVQVMPIHARLLLNHPTGDRTHLLLGAGYTHVEYGDDANASADGFGALLGFRYQVLKALSFRFEGTADLYPTSDFVDTDNQVDYAMQFGFSWTPGGGPGDKDKDGVTDDLDQCPNTPAGEKVDATGCPLPKDSDGDGVMDNADKCPNTPKGEKVDATGCPLPKDSDGDGVMDNADKCPGTPAGTKVDKNGCPQLFEENKTTFVLEGVNFETAKADLLPGAVEVLDRVATTLAAYPDVRVEVAGHTDNKGSHAYNVKLSQKRADAVRNYLIGKGIAADRMVAKGYGPDKPMASNATEEGRAQNRRTELNKL